MYFYLHVYFSIRLALLERYWLTSEITIIAQQPQVQVPYWYCAF